MKINGTLITARMRKTVAFLIPIILLLVPVVSVTAGEPTELKIVQPGNTADIHYICRLMTGEVVAATDVPAENQSKSNIFVLRKEIAPLLIKAKRADMTLTATREEPFEDEIADRLAALVVGMKEGESRQVELTAQNNPRLDEKNYVVRLAKVRIRPKELTMSVAAYKYKTRQDPEAGQAYTIEPEFKGKVVTVTQADVIIRFYASPGDVIQTPFGPGRIRDDGQNYKVEIDARKGGLTRMGGLIGRIVDVDDKTITVDYRNPFGGETLNCNVTVNKVAGDKSIESEKGQ